MTKDAISETLIHVEQEPLESTGNMKVIPSGEAGKSRRRSEREYRDMLNAQGLSVPEEMIRKWYRNQ